MRGYKRYILFQGLIDTLDLYTGHFISILEEKGAKCLLLQADAMEAEMQRLQAFLLAGIGQENTAVIAFNNIGLHLELETGENIWEKFQIPFYNILMDHPFHYKKALDTAPSTMRLLCMDQDHVAYVRRFFPGVASVGFFPHGGIELSDQPNIPIADRPIEVLYAGGLSRFAAEGLIPDLGAIREFDAFALVQEALESLISQPWQTTAQAVEACLKKRELEMDDAALGRLIARLRFVDSFAVSFYREQVIRTLVESGIRVTVFGVGWDRAEWADNPNLVFGGEIPPIQVLELMNRSKIVLNTMTWFKRGAHDRVFNGMLAGAAVVTDGSAYLEEKFRDGKDLVMFGLQGLKDMRQRVEDLLENPDRAQKLADCGYEAAKAGHLWKNRLEEVFVL